MEQPQATSYRNVLLALAITVAAGAIELLASLRSGSVFLVADAAHLLAHAVIFGLLLIPRSAFAGRGEQLARRGVLGLILIIAACIIGDSVRALLASGTSPEPAFMLASLLGLGANLTSALLLRTSALTRASFRAALTHELSDGAMTVVALFGALVIARWKVRWVDPTLAFGVGVWLAIWVVGQLGHHGEVTRSLAEATKR